MSDTPPIDGLATISAEDLVKTLRAPEHWAAFVVSMVSLKEVKQAREASLVENAQKVELVQRDEALEALEAVINGSGKDISNSYPQISKSVANIEAKSELISQLLSSHDFTRALRFVKIRDNLEKMLEKYMAPGQVIPPDVALALLLYVNKEADKLQTKVAAGTPEVKDLSSLLAKVNLVLGEQEDAITRQITANTRPQGREIIRRLASRMQRLAKGAAPPENQ